MVRGSHLLWGGADPRLALHVTELGFEYPVSGEYLHWTMPLPKDLMKFVLKLKP